MKRNLAIAGAVVLIVGLIAISLAMRTDPEPELEPMNGRGPRCRFVMRGARRRGADRRQALLVRHLTAPNVRHFRPTGG